MIDEQTSVRKGEFWGLAYDNESFYWYDRKIGIVAITLGGLLTVAVTLGFTMTVLVSLVNTWGLETQTVPIVTPPAHARETCAVDLQGRFEMLGQYNDRPVVRYMRQSWWWGQCADRELVYFDVARYRQLQNDYEALRLKALHD